MKALFLPLVIAAIPAFATGTGKLFVVVHTTDAIVKNYVCSDGLNGTDDGNVVRSSMDSQGSFIWHAVGGTAPYTQISGPAGSMGGCVTVVDAEGQIATGCGTVGVVEIRVPYDCGSNQPLPLPPAKRAVEEKKAATGSTATPPPTTGPVDPVRNDPVEVATNPHTGDAPVVKTPVRNPGPTHNPKPTTTRPNRDGNFHKPAGTRNRTNNGTTITRPSTTPSTGNPGGNSSGGTTVTPTR